MADKIFDKEVSLWKEWKANPGPEALNNLLDHLGPTINAKVKTFESAPLPTSAIRLEAKKWAMKSFDTYDPGKNTRLSTHTTNWLRKVNRYVYGRQNVGYIPEDRVIKIRTFENVKSNLQSRLNREPSTVELADELAWPVAEVERMEKELRKDIAPTDTMGDFGYVQSDPSREVLNYIYFELSPQEQLVYDYTIGAHGKQKLSGKDIASRLNISQSKISQIKRQIGDKIEGYRQ